MAKFRKKPVVIEAMRYLPVKVTKSGAENVYAQIAFDAWLEPLAKNAGRWPLKYVGDSLIIPTLEGDHEARPGDWIICGVNGEIYPCKPDIFKRTYEPV